MRIPGREVKHQGASEPSGFRQKFSRRSLSRRSAQLRGRQPWGPRPSPPRQPSFSLARVFLRRKVMPVRGLRIPTLAGHARGGGVGRAPVALALPAEAAERRVFAVRRCLRPLEVQRRVAVRARGGAGALPPPPPPPALSPPSHPPGPGPAPRTPAYRSGADRRTRALRGGRWCSTRAALSRLDSGSSCRRDFCQGIWAAAGREHNPGSAGCGTTTPGTT